MKSVEEPVTILYIVGFRRSGSTLLDIVLGNHSQIESTGELAEISRNYWIKNSTRYCGCGKRIHSCPFWSQVRQTWIERVGADDAEKYAELQKTFHSYRTLPRMLLEKYKPSSQFRAYSRLNRALFESIREVSGNPVVLDSSKNRVRALAFSMTPGVDLHLIHLVRDARGVAASQKKSFQKDEKAGIPRNYRARSIWNSIILWVAANLLSELVCSQVDRRKMVRVRYEDFMSTPKEVLDNIGSLIHLDLAEVTETIAAGEALQVGHNVGGNHLRMKDEVRVQPTAGKWDGALSAREQNVIWLLTGWLMRKYGYEK
jgi:hypothetical protein